ncbi:hypothetical protein D0T57_10160 [Dysgonomonas sp. 511]|nr:hypothetical protein [Dysgonomonas sp. 511]
MIECLLCKKKIKKINKDSHTLALAPILVKTAGFPVPISIFGFPNPRFISTFVVREVFHKLQ